MRTLETKGNLARVLDALPKQRFTRQGAFDRLVPTFDKLQVSNAITWGVKNRRLVSVERGVYEWSTGNEERKGRADMMRDLHAAILAENTARARAMFRTAATHRAKAVELRRQLGIAERVLV